MCVWGGIIEKSKKKGREEEERRERGWVGDREMFRNDVIIQKKKKLLKYSLRGWSENQIFIGYRSTFYRI